MKSIKKYIVMTITAMIISGMLTGCSVNKTTEKPVGFSDVTKKTEVAKEGTDEMTAYFKAKESCTLKIIIFGSSTTDASKTVSAALSKITKEKLNCDVDITQIGFGNYSEQLNMMLSSGDEFDLFAPIGSATDMVTNEQIQPISNFLEKYGSGIMSIVPERDWAASTYNGKIYGVPVNAEKAQQLGFGMRKDICDKLGIEYKGMSTLDEIHDALVKVKRAYPDMYPVVSDSGMMFSGISWIGQDCAGDSYNLTVAEDQFADKIKIVNLFDTELFKKRVNMLYQWAKEGLIMPDASTNTETAISLVSAGKAFGYFQHMKPGWEQEQSDQTGRKMVSVRYGEPVATTDQITWYVPAASVDPERAVALLNLMYTDTKVSNLVVNGIEGRDYIVKDKERGIAGYPEGVDSSTAAYYRMGWGWPNQQISYIWEGQDTDIWEQYKKFNNNSKVKKDFGFTFNSSNVMNEITSCTNVYEKYVPALYAGSLNPETTLPKMNTEMKEAGIDVIIKEKQAQIDDWLAKKRST